MKQISTYTDNVFFLFSFTVAVNVAGVKLELSENLTLAPLLSFFQGGEKNDG